MDKCELKRIIEFETIKDSIKSHLNWSGHLYPDFDFTYTTPHHPTLTIDCYNETDADIFLNIVNKSISDNNYIYSTTKNGCIITII
jgi:hypothetical protein